MDGWETNTRALAQGSGRGTPRDAVVVGSSHALCALDGSLGSIASGSSASLGSNLSGPLPERRKRPLRPSMEIRKKKLDTSLLQVRPNGVLMVSCGHASACMGQVAYMLSMEQRVYAWYLG